MHKEHHGIFYGVTASLITAVMAILIKLTVGVPAETIVFSRFAIGLPFIWMMARSKGIHFSMKEVPKHLTRGIFGFVSIYSYVYAIKMIYLVNAVTLANTSPLFMPFIVMFFNKLIVSKLRFFATAVGFLGVVILLRPSGRLLEVGDLFALMTGLLSAIAMIQVRMLSKTESTEKILFYYFSISSVLSLYPMMVTWKPIPSLLIGIYVIIIGVCSFLFQYALTKSYTHAPATKASILNYLAVLFSGVGGWLFLDEVPDMWVWVGAGIIILSAIMAIFDKTPAKHFKQ